MPKSLSVRKRAIKIREELPNTSVSFRTIQRSYKSLTEELFGNVSFDDLSIEEQALVEAEVRKDAAFRDRKHKRELKTILENLKDQLAPTYCIEYGGLKTRTSRLLQDTNRKWMELTDEEQDELIRKVKDLTIESQSSGRWIEKKCILDGVEIGSIKALHKYLQDSWSEDFYELATFSRILKENFSADSHHQILLTKKCVLDHLTVTARKKKQICPPDPNSKKIRLESLCDELISEGTETSLSSLDNIYSKLFNSEKCSDPWRSLSDKLKDERIDILKQYYISTPPKMNRKKQWIVDLNGAIQILTSKDLHILVSDDFLTETIGYQPFCRTLNKLNESCDNSVVDGNKIMSLEKLQQIAYEKHKVLPGTIYKITILKGKYGGYYYVGVTQAMLVERLMWHKMDAFRPAHANSTRKMHLAIRDAVKHGSIKDVTKIESLEKEVAVGQLTERETKYIRDYSGDKLLNSTKSGHSVGGRGSTRTVRYNDVEYGLSEAIRVFAKDNNITEDQFEKFAARLRSNFYPKHDFASAASSALAGVDGRKSRSDQAAYNVDDTKMTIKDIVASDAFPGLNHPEKVKSLLHRNGVLGKYAGEKNIGPVLRGEVRLKKITTPDIKGFIDVLTPDLEVGLGLDRGGLTSWSQLAKQLDQPKSSINDKARRYTDFPEEFWVQLFKSK